MTSPADQILRKMHRYRMGQEVSDRQWRDICGLLTAQGRSLDLEQLTSDAEAADLGDLLDRALAETDLRP